MLGHNAACVRKSVSLSGSTRPNEPSAGFPSEFVDTQAGTAHLFAFKPLRKVQFMAMLFFIESLSCLYFLVHF